MRHNLSIAGHAIRLRPVVDDDAPLVLRLRTDPKLGRYLHPTSDSLDEQLAWFARYYERPGDYYFVVERLDTGGAEGLISIYDIDFEAGCGAWGRWILRSGSLVAVESVWLIYRCAFEQLELRSVYSRTLAENAPVVSFHDSCGIRDRRLLPGHFDIGGQRRDAVEHRLDRQAWAEIGPRLENLARGVARKLKRA